MSERIYVKGKPLNSAQYQDPEYDHLRHTLTAEDVAWLKKWMDPISRYVLSNGPPQWHVGEKQLFATADGPLPFEEFKKHVETTRKRT